MEYWKMDGAGNDFVVINNLKEKIDPARFPDIARKLCDRELSVGADGLMVVEKAESPNADFKMIFYNLDGSMGEMCGNGARCICRFGYENGLSGETQTVETTAGLLTGRRESESDYTVKIQRPENVRINEMISAAGKKLIVSYLEFGNPGIPHVVVEISNLAGADKNTLFELGREIRYNKAFEKGANVNFFEQTGSEKVSLLTYERGVENFTKACGTGSAATVYTLALQGRVRGKKTKVESMGGQLVIDIRTGPKNEESIYLSGPADIIKKGNINF